MPRDVIDDGDESKTCVPTVHKAWIAMCVDLRDHEVVGLKVGKQPWSAFEVWMWMLFEAARRDRNRLVGGQMVHLRRGQLAVSERFLAREAKWGRKAVHVFFERLERFGMITIAKASREGQLLLAIPKTDCLGARKGPGITILTICNYEKYQTPPSRREPRRGQQGASKGPARGQDITENTDTEEEKGADVRITFEGGRIELFGDLLAYWLNRFDGDAGRLELGLLQATGYVQANSSKPLEAQVSAQLARQCADKVDRDKRSQSKPKSASKRAEAHAEARAMLALIEGGIAA